MLEKHFFHCVNTFSIFTTNMTTKGFISPSSQVHNHMNALYLPCKYWIQMNNGEGVKFFKKWIFLETAQTYYPNHLSTLRAHPTLHYPNHLHDMIPWGIRGERALFAESGHLEFHVTYSKFNLAEETWVHLHPWHPC